MADQQPNQVIIQRALRAEKRAEKLEKEIELIKSRIKVNKLISPL